MTQKPVVTPFSRRALSVTAGLRLQRRTASTSYTGMNLGRLVIMTPCHICDLVRSPHGERSMVPTVELTMGTMNALVHHLVKHESNTAHRLTISTALERARTAHIQAVGYRLPHNHGHHQDGVPHLLG